MPTANGTIFTIPSTDYPTIKSAIDDLGKAKNCIFNVSGTLQGVDQTVTKTTDEYNYTLQQSCAHTLKAENGVKFTTIVNGFKTVDLNGASSFSRITGGSLKETKKRSEKSGTVTETLTIDSKPDGTFSMNNQTGETAGSDRGMVYNFKNVSIQSVGGIVMDTLDGSTLSINDKETWKASGTYSASSTKKYAIKSTSATISGRNIQIDEVGGFAKLNISGENTYPASVNDSGKISLPNGYTAPTGAFTPEYHYVTIGEIFAGDETDVQKITPSGDNHIRTNEAKCTPKGTVVLNTVNVIGRIDGAKKLTVSNSILASASAIKQTFKTDFTIANFGKESQTILAQKIKSTEKADGKFTSFNTHVTGSIIGFSTVDLKVGTTIDNNVALVCGPDNDSSSLSAPVIGYDLLDFLGEAIVPHILDINATDTTTSGKYSSEVNGSLTLDVGSAIEGSIVGFKKITLDQNSHVGGDIFAYKMDAKTSNDYTAFTLEENMTLTASGTLTIKDDKEYEFPIFVTDNGAWLNVLQMDDKPTIGGSIFGCSTVNVSEAAIAGSAYSGKLTAKISDTSQGTSGTISLACNGKFNASECIVGGGLYYYSTATLDDCTVSGDIALRTETLNAQEELVSKKVSGTLNAKDSTLGGDIDAKTVKLTNCDIANAVTITGSDITLNSGSGEYVVKCTGTLTATDTDLSKATIAGFKKVTVSDGGVGAIACEDGKGSLTLTDVTMIESEAESAIGNFKSISLKGDNFLRDIKAGDVNNSISISGDASIGTIDGGDGTDTIKLSSANLVVHSITNIEKISGSGTLYLFEALEEDCVVNSKIDIVMLDQNTMNAVSEEDLVRYQTFCDWNFPEEAQYASFAAGETTYLVSDNRVIGTLA